MNLMKIKLIKKETILSLALIVGFLILVGLNTNVLASNEVPQFNSLNLSSTAGNGNTSNSIEIVNTATQNNANTLNAVNNTPGQLADTGLEDLPYLLITLLGVSVIFAYKKIQEYKSF